MLLLSGENIGGVDLHPDADRVLLGELEIKKRVDELGAAISRDYAGQELIMVGILKGAMIFMADLVRALDIPARLDFMVVSSYGATSKSSGVVRILKDLEQSVEGRHLIIVEDIVDSGLTLNYLAANLKSRGPASLKICTLLDKPDRRQVEVKLDYNGFVIPDEFVVGYGLDYDEKYRNLREIIVLKREVYS